MGKHAIREIALSDAEWVFEACQDLQIQYWTTVPRPYLLEHAMSFVLGEVPEYKIWAIENEEHQPVGVISIHSVDPSGDAEIGYWIAAWGRGRSASTQAILLLEEYAKSDPTITALVARISDLNVASRRAVLAAGFVAAGSSNRSCPAGNQESSATNYRKELGR